MKLLHDHLVCKQTKICHRTRFGLICSYLVTVLYHLDYSYRASLNGNLIVNKKVLLCERKRHTACHVASTCYVVLTGYPPWAGTPPGRVPPSCQGTPLAGYPPGQGTPPTRVPPRQGTPPPDFENDCLATCP